MKNQKIFSIYDTKAEAYHFPFLCRTAEVAYRQFAVACCDMEHDFSKFAADYTLFEIGEWIEDSGTVEMLDVHMPIANGIEAASHGDKAGAVRNG